MAPAQTVFSRLNRRLRRALKARMGAASTPRKLEPKRAGVVAGAVARVSRGALMASSSVGLALAAGAFAFPDAAHAQAVMRGVERLPGGKWTGAKAPTVAVTNTGFRTTIEQTQQKALLDWRRFNIQNGDEVYFNQEAADWIAFNRIWDTDPTLIDGKITARGQVYLMNTNGLIFGENARINVNTLLATSNLLTEEQFEAGIGDRRSTSEGSPTGAAFNDFIGNPENRRMDVVTDAGADGEFGTGDDVVTDFGFTRIADPAQRFSAYLEQSRVSVREGARIVAGADVRNVASTDANGNTVFTPQIAEGAGTPGKIMLFGTNVSNAGVLDAGVNGQVILAAGERTYLLPSLEPSFRRGFDVEVSPATTRARAGVGDIINRINDGVNSVAANTGEIVARQGNITMVGTDVEQLGDVTATTSGVLNGLIELRATTGVTEATGGSNPLARARGGRVRLGEGSVTAVLPEEGGQRVAAGQDVPQSEITLNGRTVLLETGSAAVAPGGVVNAVANAYGDGLTARANGVFNIQFNTPRNKSEGTLGDIIIESGAVIDVSGVDGLQLSVADLIAPVDVESNELANVPAQQDGVLDGEVVFVDITRGSRVVDWTGALGTRLLSTQERSLEGGAINLISNGTVIVDEGAILDISGGSVDYQSGFVRTTRLRLADGRTVDISAASPTARYTSVLLSDPYFVEGFTEGFDAGSLRVLAPGIYLGGDLRAGVTPGDRQLRFDGAGGRLPFTPPDPVGLALNDDGTIAADSVLQPVNMLPRGGSIRIGETDFQTFSGFQTKNIRITADFEGFEVEEAADIVELLIDAEFSSDDVIRALANTPGFGFDSDLSSNGFITDDFISNSGAASLFVGNALIFDDRSFVVDDNASLTLAGAGALTFATSVRDERVIDIGDNFSVRAPGGAVTSSEVDFGDGLVIDVSGGWFNELAPGGDPFAMPFIDGGDIFLTNALFEGAATLNVSGGARNRVVGAVGPDGRAPLEQDFGRAGSITFGETPGGRDGAFTVEQFDGLNVLVAGFAGAGSVSFSLSGSDIVISDSVVAEEDREEGVLYFTDDILNGIGAAEISFELVGDILISSGVDLTLQQQTLVLNEGFETIATGADLLAVATPSILSRRERIDLYGNDNPDALIATNLRFAQQPAGASSFTFEEGARIALDPGSSVVVEGQGLVRIAGVIETPGGSIQIGSGDTVWLDDSARLIARGFAETFRDPARQIRRADLLSGGDITVSAPVVVTQAGSVIDVSGADPVEVDILTRLRSGVFVRRAGRVGGDAGTITLTSVNGGFVAGSLLGAPGREGARGGTLTIRGGGDAEAVPISEAQLESFLEDLFAGAYGYEDTLNQYFKATFENGETGYEFRYENAVVGAFGEDNATIDAILDVLYAGQGPFEALPTPVTERTGTRRFLAFSPGSYSYDSTGSDISEETDAELLTQILLSSLPAVDGGGLRLTDGDPLPADLTPEGLDAFFNQPPTSLDDIIANIGAPEAGLYEIQNSQEAFANTVAVLLRAADPDTAAPSAGLQVDANSFQGNFDTLTFNGDLNTASDLTISARRQINLPGTILGTSANLTIEAPYVTWGGQTSILRADSVLGGGIPESRQLFEENGVLTVNADHVDFTGIVRGTRRFSEIVVNSRGDIRAIDFGRDVPAAGFPEGEILSARTDDLEPGGGLRAEAPIVMNAGQIYPGSSTDMVISSATSVTIGQSRSRRLNGPALSAGGTLEIFAPLIEQGGTLRAPQGAITFNGDTVRLLADSVTSASLEGLLIPYGVVVQNDNWFRDTTAPGDPVAGGESIDTPPQRSIVFDAQDVSIAQDAVVDVSGGGDVIARQFVSGPEGSVDIIRQNDQAFAIVPVFGNNVAAPIAPGTLIPLDSFRTPGATVVGELQPGGVTAPFGLEVTLAGGNGIAPGTYTVLPAEYAIVPGAYLVEPVEGDTPSASFTSTLFDGSAYMAGRFSVSGTPIADALPQTFRVSTFSQLNDRAEYSVFGANSFFTSDPFVLRQVQRGIEPDLGVRTPADGGRFAFDLTGSLNIEPGASVLSGGVDGARGGLGDIVSNRVAVISDPQTPEEEAERDRLLAEGFLVLTTSDVESIGAGSLLIGGVRRQTAEGTLFDVSQGAETVIVDTSAADPLAGEEVLLIARDSVTIRENSVIAASGAPVADASTRILGLTDIGDVRVVSIERQPENLSAFVQVSSAASGDISRQLSPFEGRVGTDDGVTVRTVLTSDVQGDVIVEAGARLEAAGAETIRSSIILDGSRDVQFQETPGAADGVQILADRFVAGASAVNLGDAGRPLSGLTLSQASLTSLSETIDDLALTSRTSINVFGDVSFSVAEALRFDADEIVADAASNGSLDITAGSAAFVSSLPAAQDAAPGTGTGALTVTITGDANADLVFGDGEKSFAGFASYNFSAAGQTIFEGANSANTFDADATFAAQRFAVRRGSAASLDVDGALSFETTQASDFAGLAALPVLTDIENVGASLQATAGDIFVNAGFQTRSGALSFRATGGDVTLGSGAVLDATGQAIQFYDVLEAFDAGSVSLVSEQGDVVIAEGARIDVSGDAQGGDAGVVVVEAANGAASLDGAFTGTASDGFAGGSFALTAAGGQAGFSAVNALLEAGGFNNERRFRFTSGDVTVTTDIAVNALEVVADAGDIIIGNGAAPIRIETTGDEGGDIRFVAGGDLIVRSGAAIDASAKGEGDFDGGRIELAIDDADLADRIVVENGAAFNVAGSGEGRGGVVYVRAPQLSGGDLVAVAEFGADVAGGPTVLEAYRSYEDVSTVDGAFIATAEADAAAFMSAGNLTAIYDRLGRAGDLGFQVWAGIEARSSGDMTFVGETLTLADINGTAVNDAGQEITDDAGLTTAWNLADLRYDDPRAGATSRAAGALTLRAGGALAVDGNISDGFIDPVRTSDWMSGGPAAPELTNDASWNIDLVAGADLGSADARNVSAASDDGVTLGRFVQGALVRTGTGDIGVYAAGDVELASQSSVIYTAGTQSAAVANFEAPTSNRAGESFVAYYPENGGDITIDAGGDILGAVSTDTIAYRDWLIMRGAVFAGVLGNPNPLFNTGQPSDYSADAPFLISNNGTPDDPSDDFIQQTSASIAYDEFRQGIAAFGDGDINIDAGGDIDTLGVSIAQTTRIAGGTEDMRQKTAVHNGRGDMRVAAGGHDVPEEKIRSRWQRLWGNVVAMIELADSAEVFDNSGPGPTTIATFVAGDIVGAPRWPAWTPAQLALRWPMAGDPR